MGEEANGPNQADAFAEKRTNADASEKAVAPEEINIDVHTTILDSPTKQMRTSSSDCSIYGHNAVSTKNESSSKLRSHQIRSASLPHFLALMRLKAFSQFTTWFMRYVRKYYKYYYNRILPREDESSQVNNPRAPNTQFVPHFLALMRS